MGDPNAIKEEAKPFNEQDFCNFLVQGIKDAIADRTEFDKLIDNWYNDWRDIKAIKTSPWKGCANWSVPISSTSSDSITPRVIEGNFDINPPIEAKAINKTAEDYKDIIRNFLLWDLAAHPELYQQLWFYAQNTTWAGTGFIKSYFLKEKGQPEERQVKAYIVEGEVAKDPATGLALIVNQQNTERFQQAQVPVDIQTVTEKQRRWKHYHPDLVTLDIKDVLFPSTCESIQDAWENAFIAVRVWRTKDFLRRQLKQDDKALYDNLSKVKIKELEMRQQKAKDAREREQIAHYASKSAKIECFEVYANYDIDDDGLEEKVVAVLHVPQKLLFGYEKYPYKHGRCPIIPGYIHPLHKQPFGVGIPEMLYDTKGEIDSIHNQRTDRGSLHNDPILTHTERSGFNRKKHFPGPGRQWRLQDRSENAIGYMQPQKTEVTTFREEQLTLGYSQKRTGVTDYALGSESETASNKTATGIMALIQEGNIGFRHFIRWMSLSFAEIFQQRFDLYQQYWGHADDEEVKQWVQEILDIPGNPLAEQGLEAIKQKFNIVMTATKEDKNLELKKAQAAYDIISQNPLMQQFPFKLREATIKLLRSTGIQNPEECLPTKEEIQQWQVEVQKQAMLELEQEKAKQNVAEAEKRGHDAAIVRHEALGGQ